MSGVAVFPVNHCEVFDAPPVLLLEGRIARPVTGYHHFGLRAMGNRVGRSAASDGRSVAFECMLGSGCMDQGAGQNENRSTASTMISPGSPAVKPDSRSGNTQLACSRKDRARPVTRPVRAKGGRVGAPGS